MKRTPWMPLYCDDLIASCADMSGEEFGAYVRLLCHIWTRGPIENDEKVACRIACCNRRTFRRISSRFCIVTREDFSEGLSQTRLEEERFKRRLKADERSTSGKKGAARRWQLQHGSANGSAYSNSIAYHNHSKIREPKTAVAARVSGQRPPVEGGGLPATPVGRIEPDDSASRLRTFITATRKGPAR